MLIAWNGSAQSTRALQGALPLLQRAKQIEIVMFTDGKDMADEALRMEKPLLSYLGRHAIRANVIHKTNAGDSDQKIGHSLLFMAAEFNSDLLVMGCYGHSRFKEVLLGGVTRTILQSMTIPVLMAH